MSAKVPRDIEHISPKNLRKYEKWYESHVRCPSKKKSTSQEKRSINQKLVDRKKKLTYWETRTGRWAEMAQNDYRRQIEKLTKRLEDLI